MTRTGAAFEVEVRCALRHRQQIAQVRAVPGETVADVVRRSGILARFPEVDAACHSFAIHGARVDPDKAVLPGDRVDVLRGLAVDPRQARRRRARKNAGEVLNPAGAGDAGRDHAGRDKDGEQPLSASPQAAGTPVPRP